MHNWICNFLGCIPLVTWGGNNSLDFAGSTSEALVNRLTGALLFGPTKYQHWTSCQEVKIKECTHENTDEITIQIGRLERKLKITNRKRKVNEMLKYIFANERGYRGSDLTTVLWIRIHTIKNWGKDSTDRQKVSVHNSDLSWCASTVVFFNTF